MAKRYKEEEIIKIPLLILEIIRPFRSVFDTRKDSAKIIVSK